MAAKRSVSVLRPASNALGTTYFRANCCQRAQFFTRPTFIHTSRPRKFSPAAIAPVRHASSGSDPEKLAKTGLYDLHAANGAKFVPFGGYSMPVQYSGLSIIDSHNWTRDRASLFDVGHMVQHEFSGPGAEAFLQRITPSSLSSLPPYNSTLSTLLHRETGGIVDDTVITRLPDKFYVVTNAGCRGKDLAYIAAELKAWNDSNEHVEWELLENQGLVALQGPLAAKILSSALDGKSRAALETLYFGQCMYATIARTDAMVLVSRGGYTGEDGFEISTPPYTTEAIAQFLLDSAKDDLRLAGLGARDTLRLEAGMCLYGHDLDDSTTPVEAALSWIIGKDRRTSGGFHGDSVILQQLKKKSEGGGVSRRRVGFIVEGAPAREGAEVVNEAGEKIGNITSGCPSPSLKKNIAMGYVQDGMHKSGTEVGVVIRGKRRKATVTKMPFIQSKYFKAPVNK
ncbi:glycine cleavage system T protein [Lindgomyces ingoldianus]|uniref:Glycine cleavage system T protein n=1 Tax=Lindgomyces ingoldianus TaxID=673940 RepID=A0ACB6Q909_9PLEO|nr:glycine cleavage system T protein [Lindgomyces ingoldianus]KAF2463382.1 glycine cleavage system T protein [Lindgomyces ingoldianus]